MTKILMITSAAYFILSGLLLTFFPQEVYAWQNASADSFHLIIAQTLGASMLALAVLNWYSKNNILGGIYGKPLTLANFLFFFVSFMTYLKADGGALVWTLTAINGIFATTFGYITFTHPFDKK